MGNWTRETQVYLTAKYFSPKKQFCAYFNEEQVESKRTFYNPITRKNEKKIVYKTYWKLENLVTGETLPHEFKSLSEAKVFAESMEN